MKCAIALDINEGKYPATVEQFGAKTIASNSTTVVHPRDLSVKRFTDGRVSLKIQAPFQKQLVTYLQTANQLLLVELLVRWKM
jgi:hypothetical protein